MSYHYWIAPEIFDKFPGYCRGVVIAKAIENGPSPDTLVTELRQAEAALTGLLNSDTFTNHPRIASWREAYRSLGVKPSEFRPSMDALVRRVLKKDPLPAINKIVDLGNLVSIRRLLPVGAHAIDVIHQDIALRIARGDEVFEPFGSDLVEHPSPGEVVFVEGQTVLTRRWTWRQAKHTLVLPESTAVEINVDGLPPVSVEEVEDICQELSGLVEQYCKGSTRIGVLKQDAPVIDL